MGFHLGGSLYRNTFGTAELRSIFDDEGYVDRFLEVEAALARAEADIGLVPAEAAETITDRATGEHVDLNRVEANLAEQGLLSMSIIDAWKEELGEAGEYVHWGATSQDVMDTTTVLQVREGMEIVERDAEAIREILADLVVAHADTPMIGRTHHVHAVPTTFGLKAAGWLDEFDRDLARLEAARDRAVAGQFFGAVGMLASLGANGRAVQRGVAAELDLPMPDVSWHAARDRFAELLTAFAVTATTLARIANQILVLNRPEIGELSERVDEGSVGSSTMPHKRNPKRAETVVALARLLRGNAHVMTEVMESFDERSASTWHVEFAIVPELFLYVGRCLANARDLLDSLAVDPEAMRTNMEVHGDLIASEPVMMAISEEFGRQTAHSIVFEGAMAAIDSDRSFADCLLADERVANAFSPEEVAELIDPAGYTGLATELALDSIAGRNPDI